MDMFTLGYLGEAISQNTRAIRESNEVPSREQIVNELIEEGILLPEYDWSEKEFHAELERITKDWFERHPEVKRGTGEFQEKYPELEKVAETMQTMIEKGRISPVEYTELYRNLYRF